jgi:hypothetical protein
MEQVRFQSLPDSVPMTVRGDFGFDPEKRTKGALPVSDRQKISVILLYMAG